MDGEYSPVETSRHSNDDDDCLYHNFPQTAEAPILVCFDARGQAGRLAISREAARRERGTRVHAQLASSRLESNFV